MYQDAVNKVIHHATSLQTQIDAYTLKHSILMTECVHEETSELLSKIIDILNSLGEIIRDDVTDKDISALVCSVKEVFQAKSNNELLLVYQVEINDHNAVMQAYGIAANLAWIAKPKLFPFIASLWANYCVKQKVKSALAYVYFAAVLCQDISNKEDVLVGYRLGKLALRMLHEHGSASSELPVIYLWYCNVGALFEPIQAVNDMHQQAINISLKMGNSSIAALHKIFLTPRLIYAGVYLPKLKECLKREISMHGHPHSFAVLQMKQRINYEGICNLIGDHTSQNFSEGSDESFYDHGPSSVMNMMILTYLGFYERAKHMAKRWEILDCEESGPVVSLRSAYTSFYYCLSCIGLRRKKNPKSKRSPENTMQLLNIVQEAAEVSPYNFQNKLALLTAEKLSMMSSRNADAEAQYTAAIELSKSSHFVHEEGLSCELAGLHYERLGNSTKALELFEQAERCYETWGSAVKSRQIQEKIEVMGTFNVTHVA